MTTKKYQCQMCGATKMLDPKKWGRANEDSYCHCRPNTPSLMDSENHIRSMKKYDHVFRGMKTL